MRVVVVPRPDGGGRLRPVGADGTPAGPVEEVDDLAARVAEWERVARPRWVWAATAEVYPELLRAGVRVRRCHDLALTEALLLGWACRHGEPRWWGAAWARLRGGPVPPDPPVRRREEHQPALFETVAAGTPEVDPVEALAAVLADQERRVAEVDHPGLMRLLVAAESAGSLAAAEMTHHGVPWRADAHDALLTELLGSRPPAGALPARLAELAGRVVAAFGGRAVNPDSPADLVRAFAHDGVDLPSTRSWVLREVDHPAVEPLLRYKELSRLYTAHGWSWLESWVRDGRFRPEYVVGGVVSGRWASRGGAALQVPKVVRRAVVADPGWVLVVADAAQLEPRVLAALSGDRGFARVAGEGDLYAAVAEEVFGGDRKRAKLGLLSAMYGGTSGGAGPLLAVLRQRFPEAMGFVEAAARAGEEGRVVRSRLGRTSPPPSARWHAVIERGADPGAGEAEKRQARRVARDWGRFTRNFVVQASAAEWALVLVAVLRQRVGRWAGSAELVFFQHDEVMLHCRREVAEDVAEAVRWAGVEATRWVFGSTPVRFPLEVSVVDCYADAK
ncbi:bifunctional 3'-5' exonuclease/DNA polymerase [Streptoalloteichus tenebrarius]|nr:bifunctional 3'-5' exonuclease/DNA polymerase [Streptoalloteichus tenebrarius]BFE98601.1 bifunctional 3'-5' exonuclease/DNA polymerase [Streptoalloteichus tenebrarius]